MAEYQLNEGQKEALQWLTAFCLGKNRYRRVLLSGHAGTGKTFTINRVVEAVRRVDPSVNFGMTAPTHKAVRVLKKHSDLRDLLDFGTIHSFLALKQLINDKGEIEYKPDFNKDRQRRIDGVDVLILDESSMLDDKLFEHVETEMRSNDKLKVIYMGDERQIPPVGKKQATGDSNAIPFIKSRQVSHQIYLLELTEPQRQSKESAIIMYATAIREQHRNQKIAFEFPASTDHLQVAPADISVLRDFFKQYFCTENFQQDADYVKVIGWRNSTVDYFNREIRLLINNATTLPRIIDQECLIMDAPLVEGEKILLANNEEVVTSDVREDEKIIRYRMYPTSVIEQAKLEQETGESSIKKEFKCKVYKCTLTTPEGKYYPVSILHEDHEKEFQEIKNSLKNAAVKCTDHFNKKDLWKQFYKINEHFAWVKYNYCITAHKAQGSSYDYCFSLEPDMDINKDIEERNRIKYVAATRARLKLFVIKSGI